MTDQFNKTATLRRLRAAAALARTVDRELAKNFRVEVGLRTEPQYAGVPQFAEAVYHYDAGDLSDFDTMNGAAATDEAQRHGYIAHLYFSSPGDFGELVNTVTVWLGTPDFEPMLIHVPGYEIPYPGLFKEAT